MKKTHEQMIVKGKERKHTNKVVVLVSGGADSAATVLKLSEMGYKVCGLFIDYGQPNLLVEEYCVKLWVKPLFTLDSVSLSNDVRKMLDMRRKAQNDEDAFVPFRNTLFMVLAAMHANVVDADGISIGLMKEDAGVFPDSNWVHHKMLSELVSYSGARTYEMFLPIKDCSKKEVMKICEDGGLKTVSCWSDKIGGDGWWNKHYRVRDLCSM